MESLIRERTVIHSHTVLKVLVLCAAVISAGAAAMAGTPEKKAARLDQVLFIGNSYTAGISTALQKMLAGAGHREVTLSFITPGGATLAKHSADEGIRNKIRTGKWDLVVLQGQSQVPALPGKHGKSFQDAADSLARVIRENGAEPAFFMTWGRRDGDAHNAAFFPDYGTMQEKLSEAYTTAALRNRATLVPVGDAWAAVRKKNAVLGRELYVKDGSHPSPKGACLGAVVFLRVLFNDSLAEVSRPAVLSAKEWQIIKDVAANIDVTPLQVSDEKDGNEKKSEQASLPPTRKQVAKLIQALSSRKEEERLAAMDALKGAGRTAAKEIAKKFKYFNKARRLGAVEVLAALPHKEAKLMLARSAYDDKYREVRRAAAKALQGSGSPMAQQYLLKKAFGLEDRTREKAARAMANISDPSYVDALLPATREYLKYLEKKSRHEKIGKMVMNTGGGTSVGLGDSNSDRKESEIIVLELLLQDDYVSDMDRLYAWWQTNRAGFRFPSLDGK